MKYKKHELDGCNVHLIKTNQFKTITIKVDFRRKAKKEEMTIRNILTNTLIDSTKHYSTRKQLEIKSEELYNAGIQVDTLKSGKISIFSFNIKFLNEKYTEKGMNLEAINLLKEIILHPNISFNRFKKPSFSLAKRNVKNDIESIKDNPAAYSLIRMFEEISDTSPLSYRSNGYLTDIDQINEKDLYHYYQDMIQNDDVNIFIIGDVDDSIVEHFRDIKGKKQSSLKHFSLEKTSQKPNYVIENLSINNSMLRMAFTFDNITDDELNYVLKLYSYILGGSSDSKLFMKVREQESLCYSINSSSNLLHGLLMITAGIDKKDYQKVLQFINHEIEEMKVGNFNEEELQSGKKIIENSYVQLFDSPASILSLYIKQEYLKSELGKETLEKINQVTKEDIVKLANKIKMHTVFFLEGDIDE